MNDSLMSTDISIHTLHTEGDVSISSPFQTTSISIHTLHTEGDRHGKNSTNFDENFNPHPPHGG